MLTADKAPAKTVPLLPQIIPPLRLAMVLLNISLFKQLIM